MGRRHIRMLIIMVGLVVGFSMAFAQPDAVNAAAKKPGKTKITSCKVVDNTVTLKWKKMQGATDYAVYTKKTSSSKWNKVKVVKGTSAKIDTSSYPLNVYYHIRVIARKKVNGKYTGSKSWAQYNYHRYKTYY